jgi:hypothetical protein
VLEDLLQGELLAHWMVFAADDRRLQQHGLAHVETCDGLGEGAAQPLEQHAACRVIGLAQRERRQLLQSKLAHEGGVAHHSPEGLVDHAIALAFDLGL